MRVDSGQWTVVRKKDVGTQNETRENITMRHKIVLSSFIFALLSPAPAALAQSECGAQLDPGNPETVTCDPQDYPLGITYDSLGDLTLEVPDDAGDFTVNDGGVNVTAGNAADNLFWDSSAYTSGKISGTDGAVIDYLSADGDIDIDIGGTIEGATGSNATHAIRAESTGDGNVRVTTQDDVNPRGGFLVPDPVGIGIEALTTSGDITIDANGEVRSFGTAPYAIHADSSAGGNIDINTADFVGASDDASHGILAETTGAGNIAIDAAERVFSSGTAVKAITGNGDITIDTGGIGSVGTETGIYAETGGAGNIVVEIANEVEARGASSAGIHAIAGDGNITLNAIDLGRLDVDGVGIITDTNGLATINWGGVGNNLTGDEAAIRSFGAGDIVVNLLANAVPDANRLLDLRGLSGTVDLSGLSGSSQFNLQAGTAWQVSTADTILSQGDSTIVVGQAATLHTTEFTPPGPAPVLDEDAIEMPVGIDFGTGTNLLDNRGNIHVGPFRLSGSTISSRRTAYEAELRFENLDTFSNTGTIYFGQLLRGLRGGGVGGTDTIVLMQTDHWYDDILAMPGATFHGGDGSRMEMDVHLNNVGQTTCDATLRNADGDMPAADCMDLRNGAATGRTLITLNEVIPGDRGAYNPDGNVIIDAAGGSGSDPNAFVIAPDSSNYSPQLGGVIDKGLFIYPLAYDAADQQYKLYGLPGSGAQQFPLLGHAANAVWRTAADMWFERQVDQRDVERESGLGGGIWLHASANEGERDLITPILAGSETLEFDNSYTLDNSAVTFGLDLISGTRRDRAWVAGAMFGYARSRLNFEASPNTANLEGTHWGFYGSYTQGGFYLDAALNATSLDVHNDVPAMQLFPEGTELHTDVESVGGQVEFGWRWKSGRFGVEPLAGFSHVRSEFDDLNVPALDPDRFGGLVTFDDPTSSRGSLGVRLAMDDVPNFAPTSVGLTARMIEEFDGESEASIANLGPTDAPVADTFDGSFGEVAGTVSITNTAKTAAGFLKVDGTFGDDYDSVGLSAGFRYQW